MKEEWKPDSIVLRVIEAAAKKQSGKPIVAGSVSKTFDEILNDVKIGTEFGRAFHNGLLGKFEELISIFYENLVT